MVEASFARLIHSVNTILTDYISSLRKVSGADLGDDFYRQGKDLYQALDARFEREPDGGKASTVLKVFLFFPDEFRDNLQRQLVTLLPDDPDFVRELHRIVSRSLILQRQHELQLYTEFLAQETPWIWVVTALERSGKTELLQQMRKNTPSSIPIVQLDFAREQFEIDLSTGERERIDALSYLRAFAREVKGSCDPQQYNKFQKELTKTYRAYGNANNNQPLSYDRRQARGQVTEAFHDLMETFWPNRLVIHLDTCEWLMDPVNLPIGRWLVEDALLPLHNSLRSRRKQCHVVMMSNVTLALPFLESRDHRHTSLPPLDELSVQHYLQRIGVDDPSLRHLLYEMTGGHASCVSLLCELWHHWQKEGKQVSDRETLIQFQKAFYERVETGIIKLHVLDKFSASGSTKSWRSPLYPLTKYGSLLREFDLSQLKTIFGGIELPATEVEMIFDQLIHRCYIVPQKERNKYAIHELFRTVLGQYVLVQERSLWGGYHKRYLDFFQFQTDVSKLSFSTDWHYHNLSYNLALDENEELAKSYWTETLEFLLQQDVAPAPLVEAACDKTLMFTSVANVAQRYKQQNPYRKGGE